MAIDNIVCLENSLKISIACAFSASIVTLGSGAGKDPLIQRLSYPTGLEEGGGGVAADGDERLKNVINKPKK